MNSDALGTNNGSGGGLGALDQSNISVSGVTFSHNSAGSSAEQYLLKDQRLIFRVVT